MPGRHSACLRDAAQKRAAFTINRKEDAKMENRELIKKAKAAKSAEELRAIAKENEVDLTEEEAAAYFSQLH